MHVTCSSDGSGHHIQTGSEWRTVPRLVWFGSVSLDLTTHQFGKLQNLLPWTDLTSIPFNLDEEAIIAWMGWFSLAHHAPKRASARLSFIRLGEGQLSTARHGGHWMVQRIAL